MRRMPHEMNKGMMASYRPKTARAQTYCLRVLANIHILNATAIMYLCSENVGMQALEKRHRLVNDDGCIDC